MALPTSTNQSSSAAQTTTANAANARAYTAFSGLFKSFDPTQDIVTNIRNNITENVWSDNITGVLTTAYTSSIQSGSTGLYYLDIYQNPATDTIAEVQYSIAYGQINGLGSAPISTGMASPSQIIYSQYRNTLLPPTTEKFTLADSRTLDAITVVNFKRERLKEQLNPGGWELKLSGSLGKLSLIDDYSINSVGTATEGTIVYNVISGSGTTPYSPTKYYGLAYPEAGILILDAQAISGSCSVYTDAVTPGTCNNVTTFTAIKSGSYFAAQNLQSIHSTYYFVRVLNNMFNYSNNPSFTTGSLGDLRYASMIEDPKTYVTTVGLYNDNNELLAVAKVSEPIQKAFDKEISLRIRLDF